MKIDMKNKLHIFIILTVSIVCFMSVMIVLSPYIREPLGDDADKDGIKDEVDNCLNVSNPDQSDVDHDGIGDVCDSCSDTDGDGYGNPGFQANTCPDDNCPTTPNSNQTDTDQDNIGDVCDTCPTDPQNDADNDGICGGVDNCPAVSNPEQKDSDVDGIGDACEEPPIAMFTYIPLDPIHGEIIQFWDNTTLGGGVLQHWRWTFGDNTSSTEQHPKHSYMNVGSYAVQLNVTDINGKTSTITKNVTIFDNDPPEKPTIMGLSIGMTEITYSLNFTATDPDGNQIYYSIDWGDHTSQLPLGPYPSGYDVNAQHSWRTAGSYIITVKARDTHNAESNSTSFTVRMFLNIYILNPSFIQFFEQYHQILFFRILYT
jgi:PKD repeat protein